MDMYYGTLNILQSILFLIIDDAKWGLQILI